jgi:translation elongation factor EF-Ts
MQIAATGPETVEELLAQPYVRDESQTVEKLVQDVSSRVGEKVQVAKFFRIQV